jgi:hypothetical protein
MMKLKIYNLKTLVPIVVFISMTTMYGQVTSIPDPNFEQALIDQGIDSDGIINGQVLTSDIENITMLNLLTVDIANFTGLEDFTQLEELTINGEILEVFDVTNNLELTLLRIDHPETNFEIDSIESLDLSNNTNLESVYIRNLKSLKAVNFKNGNNESLTVLLLCFLLEKNCELDGLECIEVDNATAATNGEGSYANWTIDGDNFVFSEDCSTLGVADQDVVSITLYPNPVQNELFIDTTTLLQTATIYSITGQVVSKHDMLNTTTINTSKLSQGFYFITIQDIEGNTVTKKFVKK